MTNARKKNKQDKPKLKEKSAHAHMKHISLLKTINGL